MKAVLVSSLGGPECLQVADVKEPRPAPGEVLIKLALACVNFIDIQLRRGSYARSHTCPSQLLMILGIEGAGTVADVGEGVTNLAVGQVVAYCLAPGSYAQYACVPAWRVVTRTPEIPLSAATALMLQGCTAHYLGHSAFRLKAGHSCLVHAGAGGVGQLLIQIAKARGATVFATVGNAEKVDVARQRGADHCILYRETDFSQVVRQLTGGRGVEVVYDSVGHDTISRSVRRRGTCVLFGISSGPVSSVSPFHLAEAGSIFFTRPYLADYLASAKEVRWRTQDLFELLKAGKLEVAIDRRCHLTKLRQRTARWKRGARAESCSCRSTIDLAAPARAKLRRLWKENPGS
jgi:NADPH:quinone reductase